MKGELLSLKTTEKLARMNKAKKYIKQEIKGMPRNGCRIRLEEVLNILEGKNETKQS